MHFEPDSRPTTKEELARASYQYQREWRFEREKRLMEYALTLFPDWAYAKKRLEWHSYPEFNRNLSESKTQPRRPTLLPQNPQYTPKPETLSSMCFVTGADSNPPYFDLCVQMILSIRATQRYNQIPIKVLDCGLNPEDKDYLMNTLQVEVKDPGWDIDRNLIFVHDWLKHWSYNGWKGIVARPYICKHFPGFQYYFWIDADAWIQSENAIDIFLCQCEKEGMAVIKDLGRWPRALGFENCIPPHYATSMTGKPLIHGGVYCISTQHCEQYALTCEQVLKEKNQYTWGFDMALLNHFFYNIIKGNVIMDAACFDASIHVTGVRTDTQKNILTRDGKFCLGVPLLGECKHLPYKMLMVNSPNKTEARLATNTAKDLASKNPFEAEETAYHLCKTKNWSCGSLRYCTYLSPEDLYGAVEGVMS